MLIQVSLSINIFDSFTYRYDGEDSRLHIGSRVIVPVGRRLGSGWVVQKNSDYKGRVKDIIGVVNDSYLPSATFMAFIRSISTTYMCSMGMLLDYSLPPGRKSVKQVCFKDGNKYRSVVGYPFSKLTDMSKSGPLRFGYRQSGESDLDSAEKKTTQTGASHQLILGYSREDQYRERIEMFSRSGKSVLVIVPDKLSGEYLLSATKVGAHYHSGIKGSERDRIWKECLGEDVSVVIGGLSAVFLPIPNLGGVIVDRSGSPKYKGMMPPYINARLVAKRRSVIFSIPLIEGYGTFPLDVYEKKTQLSVTDNRSEKEVPVSVHRIKPKEPGVPDSLIEWVKEMVGNKQRVLLLLNRKESSLLYYCSECKRFAGCPVCGVLLQEGDPQTARCRRCGYEKKAPDDCWKCHKPLSKISDIALDSVINACRNNVLETGILSVSSSEIKDTQKILEEIKNSHIVVATPVILNPLFKNLFHAVGYIRPESMFGMESFNAAEKIFSVTSELRELVCSGGRVDIFSTFHFHYSMKYLEDEDGFFKRELKYRKWFQLPPHRFVYTFELKGPDVRGLGKVMRQIYGTWKEGLGIQKLYIPSRKKIRGSVRGIFIAHAEPESVLDSGILKTPKLQIKRCVG